MTHESHTWSGPPAALPIALVHGAMDRGAGMAKLGRRLDDRYRVLRYDRRGYGRSAPHPGPFTIAANVEDLVELLDGRPALVVGHSLGGDIALAAAVRHPDLVLGAVVFEPPMPWEPWWPSQSASAQAAGEATVRQRPEDVAEQFMRRLIGNERWEALPQRTRDVRRSEGPALIGELRDLATEPWTGDRITCPVVVGVSDHARPHHRRATAAIAERIHGAELIELTHCHHDAHVSVPAQFAERLVDPLASRLTLGGSRS